MPQLCRYFAQGRCAFGNACNSWHGEKDAAPKAKPSSASPGTICRHFLQGRCSFGDSCRSLHTRPGEPVGLGPLSRVETLPSTTVGPGAGLGYGLSVGPSGPSTGPIGPVGPPARRAGPGPIGPKEREEPRKEPDFECGICFESVKRRGERFGMLESCDHAFCLSCIRGWRREREQDKQNLRLCPVCRNESFYVIPSDTIILDPAEKRQIIDQYKQ
ncbi:unnamed protein product, partial [Effrenium voratum]